MLLLAVNRRIKEADAFVREGKFRMLDQANRDMLGTGLNGKKFGILGGTAWSGAEMTKVARSFFMDVLYWDYTRGAEMEQEGALYVGFDELLRQCDFIVLVVLRGHKGGYLLDKAQFKTMKRGAVILNVTHGHLINERELVLALRDGRVGGAGLDKLERETVPADGLFDFPNVILTPHSDGAMLKERNAIFESMVSQVLDTRMKFDKE
jgi:lactate dehydrogenase-like 2-hydroxyacid dehydrogenase